MINLLPSVADLRRRGDCFVASLLAMTAGRVCFVASLLAMTAGRVCFVASLLVVTAGNTMT